MIKKFAGICFLFISLSHYGFCNRQDDINDEYIYAFIEASKLSLLGNIAESAKLYMTCLDYDTADYVAYYKLSLIYLSVGKKQIALEYAKRAYDINSDNDWININLVKLYKLNDREKESKKLLKKLIGKENVSYIIKKTYLDFLMEKKEYKKAIKYVSEEKNKRKEMYLLYVYCYNRMNKYERSIDILKNISEYNQDDKEITGILAETYTLKGDYKKANENYKKLFYLEPGNTSFWKSYLDFGLVSKNKNIVIETFKYLLDDERIEMQDKIYLVNKIRNSEAPFADSLYNAGIEVLISEKGKTWNNDKFLLKEYLVNIKEYDMAEYYMKSLKEENNYEISYLQNLLFTIGFNNDSILEYSKEAYEKFKTEPLFVWFYATALNQKKDYSKSEKVLSGINISKIENKNLQLELYIIKAEVCERLEKYYDADQNFKAALDIDPENIVVMNNYSYYLAVRNEQLDYALGLIKYCIEKEKRNPIYLDTYAWVLYKLNDYKNAEKFIKKALNEKNIENFELYDHYGDILVKNRKIKEALNNWKNALQFNIDDENKALIENKILKYSE